MRTQCAIAALTLLTAGVLLGQVEDPFAGMWKLNVEQSQLARPVESATMRLRIAIDEVDLPLSVEKMDLEWVYADGTRETISYTARYAGTDYQIVNTATGVSIEEEARLNKIDESTREFTRLKNRKPLSVSRRVLSADGNTLTATTTLPDGTIQDIEVWDRQ